MNDELRKNIRRLLDYMWPDEQRDYEECGNPDSHIFRCMERIQLALEAEENAAEHDTFKSHFVTAKDYMFDAIDQIRKKDDEDCEAAVRAADLAIYELYKAGRILGL